MPVVRVVLVVSLALTIAAFALLVEVTLLMGAVFFTFFKVSKLLGFTFRV